MKKVLLFTQNLYLGGVQKSVSTLTNHLSRFYEVILVLAEDNKPINYILNSNVKLIKIKTVKHDLSIKNIGEMIFNYRIEELDKILSWEKPDLAISYEDYNNLILLSTNYQCKKIVSVRNSIDNLYTKTNKIHLLSSEFYFDSIQRLYPKAQKVITVSKFIKNRINELCKSNNVICIYNGIKKPKRSYKPSTKKKYILNVARLNKRKGQKDLIKAFNSIKNKIKHDLIIVGEGEERESLENLIKRFHLKNRVTLTGYDLPDKYLKNCELFVFPSLSEGFSNSILEAMISKKNIIAYDYDGSNEILPKSNIVPKAEIKQLSKKILYYLQDETLNKAKGEMFFRKVKKFSIASTLNQYLNTIEQALREK